MEHFPSQCLTHIDRARVSPSPSPASWEGSVPSARLSINQLEDHGQGFVSGVALSCLWLAKRRRWVPGEPGEGPGDLLGCSPGGSSVTQSDCCPGTPRVGVVLKGCDSLPHASRVTRRPRGWAHHPGGPCSHPPRARTRRGPQSQDHSCPCAGARPGAAVLSGRPSFTFSFP